MLKSIPTFNFDSQAKTKCGEIFCRNSTDFTVYCTFCEIKSFSFEDFLHHIKNLHFEKGFCKSEIDSQDANCFSSFYKDLTKFDAEGDRLSPCDNADNKDFENKLNYPMNISDEDSYDEPLAILNNSQKEVRKRRTTQDILSTKNDDNEVDIHFDSDEEYQLAITESELLISNFDCTHDDKSFAVFGKKKKDGKQISCNECDQIFPYKKFLYSHMVEYHLGFKCSICDKRFKHLQQRDRHEFCHTAEKVFSCDVDGCGKSFTLKYYLQRHIDSHNKELKFVCDFENCAKAFHTLRCLKAHRNRHTKPKNVVCDKCGYTCREYNKLRIHQRIHTGEKAQGCQECGKHVTSDVTLLDGHFQDRTGYKCSRCAKHSLHVPSNLDTQTTERKIICSVENCGRTFIDERHLKRHLGIHKMERNFNCDYENCGKTFKTQSSLARHKHAHRIPKTFVCDVCGFGCRSNNVLTAHQRVHNGKKSFTCEVCGKYYATNTALREHKTTHTKGRPYECSICKKTFGDRRVLMRHKYIHSDEKTFKCKLCESAFKHPNSLQGHMRHVHRESKVKLAKKPQVK